MSKYNFKLIPKLLKHLKNQERIRVVEQIGDSVIVMAGFGRVQGDGKQKEKVLGREKLTLGDGKNLGKSWVDLASNSIS
ncbi:hypothetical protein FQA39_LY08213 [Lamprigera yunnana]|nr:hypothetical protein FQA39_LY08213 [Lamprigera yunnana]